MDMGKKLILAKAADDAAFQVKLEAIHYENTGRGLKFLLDAIACHAKALKAYEEASVQ